MAGARGAHHTKSQRSNTVALLKDASVPILLIVVILLFIVAVPAGMLDVMLAINIMLSAIVLLNTIYTTDTLGLTIFPTLVVITTVYRLSLNVSSTRLILGGKSPGRVVEGFGEFVGGGNLVVGGVVFLIITLVNFIVITKGAERIAEVAARFTLDAMPGKQMAIDADLNSGLINEQDAKARRQKIQREADFYGAMDGASKFVKNDAIAGLIITFINVIGGIVLGVVLYGLPVMEALSKYTILTIGDGLVSQLPALMISIATSFIVTRSGASEMSVSQDMLAQVFGNPRVLYVAAGLSFIISFVLARAPFLLLSALLVFLGYTLSKQQKKASIAEEVEIEESEVEEIRKPENVVSLLQVEPIELEFGYGVIPLADASQGGDLLDRVVMIRRQLALELGMIVPIIRLRDNIQLSPNEYIIKIKGVQAAQGELMLDQYMAMNPGFVEEEIDGVQTIEPAFGMPAIWISENQRERAETLGYTVVDPPSVIATHLTEVIKKYAHELLSRQEVQTLVDNVRQTNPAIVDELIPKLLGIGEIQKVLANLLKESVSIRDMVTVLETLADYGNVTHDTDMLTEYVRQALGRAISSHFISDGNNSIITLDPSLEQMIMDSIQRSDAGTFLSLEPSATNSIINSLTKQVQKIAQIGRTPVVLASPVVRLYFKRLTEQVFPGLVVLSYNELDPGMEIQAAGMVSA
ncbi:MAG: flagellar biosynthesis protein FlhA [Clostridiales bacterium]|nr:flagellar biosynthesis protein FlhA [Clostridiales bacterium]